jgi:hypothetical protein
MIFGLFTGFELGIWTVGGSFSAGQAAYMADGGYRAEPAFWSVALCQINHGLLGTTRGASLPETAFSAVRSARLRDGVPAVAV